MYSEIRTLHRSKSAAWLALSCALAALAYLPILNNGFIADDYVILKRVEILKTQPLYLFLVPPENFRSTSYVIFGALKALAGYQAWPFYAFNVGLHVVNVILLFCLLRRLIDDDLTLRLAVLFFAVFQAPQEAVMWLAAMNETTMFFFALLTLLFWLRQRYLPAALTYSLALFSKESAVIIPVLALLLDFYKEAPSSLRSGYAVWSFCRRYFALAIPTAAFAAIFLLTIADNFMLTNRSYSVGPQAILVLIKTIHRLLWPWFYIFLSVAWIKTRRRPSLVKIGAYLGVVVVTMLPYVFIAYETSLMSRQLYLASAVLMTLFAVTLNPLRGTALLQVVVTTFTVFNVGYLLLRKDGQFEERAAPTTQLIAALREHRPQPTVIKNFAYPFPEIASSATLAVPGWDAGLVAVDQGDAPCSDCLQLEWDSRTRRYKASD